MLKHYTTVPVAATAQVLKERAATCPMQSPARAWLPAEAREEPRACLGATASGAKARRKLRVCTQGRRDISSSTARSPPGLEQFPCSMRREQENSQQHSDTPQV